MHSLTPGPAGTAETHCGNGLACKRDVLVGQKGVNEIERGKGRCEERARTVAVSWRMID